MSIMVNMLDDVYRKFISDEELLRLLYYEPDSPKTFKPFLPEDNLVHEHNNPAELPSDEYIRMWKIIEKHILKTSKSDDIETNRLCRVYLYLGQVRPVFYNRFVARQEIIADIFVHNSYKDNRLTRIISRLNDLLIHGRITGLGKVDIRSGYNFNAPKEYTAYRNIYEVGRSK